MAMSSEGSTIGVSFEARDRVRIVHFGAAPEGQPKSAVATLEALSTLADVHEVELVMDLVHDLPGHRERRNGEDWHEILGFTLSPETDDLRPFLIRSPSAPADATGTETR